MTRVTPDKALSFTSFSGAVDVTLPAATKANFKLRSDQGDVFTDFDLQLRTEPVAAGQRRRDGRLQIDVNNAIYGAVNAGGPEIELRSFNGNIYLRRGR